MGFFKNIASNLIKACIIAPSFGPQTHQEIVNNINSINEIISSYGFIPLIDKNIFVPQNYTSLSSLRFSNSDEFKFKHFKKIIHDDSCDLIWAARGGYGAVRIVSDLMTIDKPKKIIPIVGFSDITILHGFINNFWQWPSIHYSMPGVLEETHDNLKAKEYFKKIISNDLEEITYNLKTTHQCYNDKIQGKIIGGNLVNFFRLVGTPIEYDLNNKILFFEDIDEPARKIDGYLYQLSLLKNFKLLKAIIFGEFIEDKEEKKSIDEVIKNFAMKFELPVFLFKEDSMVGHGKINMPILLNVETEIYCEENNCKLKYIADVFYDLDC